MPDNRIRFSAEFASTGADQVKRDLEEVRQGRKALDDVIGNGARVSQEAAQGMGKIRQADFVGAMTEKAADHPPKGS